MLISAEMTDFISKLRVVTYIGSNELFFCNTSKPDRPRLIDSFLGDDFNGDVDTGVDGVRREVLGLLLDFEVQLEGSVERAALHRDHARVLVQCEVRVAGLPPHERLVVQIPVIWVLDVNTPNHRIRRFALRPKYRQLFYLLKKEYIGMDIKYTIFFKYKSNTNYSY